jgi:hypothetical protein
VMAPAEVGQCSAVDGDPCCHERILARAAPPSTRGRSETVGYVDARQFLSMQIGRITRWCNSDGPFRLEPSRPVGLDDCRPLARGHRDLTRDSHSQERDR